MDRFAANTLRTLGIIVTAILLFFGCLILLGLALCFGILANAGGSGHPDEKTMSLAVGAVVGAVLFVIGGIFTIAKLAKGIRSEPAPIPSYRPIPSASFTQLRPETKPETKPEIRPETKKEEPQTAPTPPLSDEDKLDQALASLEAKVRAPAHPQKTAPPAKVEPPLKPLPLVPLVHSQREVSPRTVDLDHLSPASRTAIQQLAYAIIAKVAAEVVLGIIGWSGALGVPRFVRVPFPVYRFGFLAWGLAAIAPNLILLYALARRPGQRAFAYALVIPSLHLLFGFFGRSAALAFILRAGQFATPLVSIAPWLLDILILYLAWKAIRQTGIEPNPERLIMASLVIFFYTSLLPLLVVMLNQLERF